MASFELDPIFIPTSFFVLGIDITVSTWLQIDLSRGLQTDNILMQINISYPLNVFVALALLLTYGCNIILLTKMYTRRKDQSSIVISGTIFCTLTIVTWCCSRFIPNSTFLFVDKTADSSLVILPTFVYLLRITQSVISACLVLIFIYSNRSAFHLIFQYKYQNPKSNPIKHIILAGLTICLNCIPIILFILDLTNTYANLLSEMFNLTTDWASTVISYFYLLDLMQWYKIKHSKGVLGRRQFNSIPNNYLNLNLKKFNRFKNPNFKLSTHNHKLSLNSATISKPRHHTDSVFVHKLSKINPE